MKLKTINYDEVRDYLKTCSPTSKIYLGADSERINVDGVWWVDVMTCLIIHIDAKHGGKFFGQITRERDYDKSLNRPRLRMMSEVYAVSQLYLDLADALDPFEVQIHLDINSNPMHGSNCAHAEAKGYVRGVTGIDPICKPDSWAASNVADAAKRLMSGDK